MVKGEMRSAKFDRGLGEPEGFEATNREGSDAGTPSGCVLCGTFGTGGVGLRPQPPANLWDPFGMESAKFDGDVR